MDFAALAESVIKVGAPLLGTALGGPIGGTAASFITRAIFGDDVSKTPDDAMALIKSGNLTPEQMASLKKADLEFKTTIAKLGIKEQEIAAADRDSARSMQTTTRSRMPAFIALVALTGFFGILICMIFVTLPAASEAPLQIMLGVLGTLVVGISNFYFGSSQGSKDKTAMMAKS
jgi:hypothetical protein